MTSFNSEIIKLESPIDVMYIMHKVYMDYSFLTEDLALEARNTHEIKNLVHNLSNWLTHLTHHADMEDLYMTDPLKFKDLKAESRYISTNEKEHQYLKTLGGAAVTTIEESTNKTIKEILADEEEAHKQISSKINEVVNISKIAIKGGDSCSNKIFRHLHKCIMELRVYEYDHFENEEAFILPLIKDHMSDEEELQCVEKLLFDYTADDPRWIIDFILQNSNETTQNLIKNLEVQLLKLRKN